MSSWEQALKNFQGSMGTGGAPRPPSPGTTGNIPYAPGMMNGSDLTPSPQNSSGQSMTGAPTAGRLRTGPVGPSPAQTPGPSPSGSQGGTGMPPAGGMDPQTAQMYVQMLMRAIDAELQNQRSPYRGY